MKQDFLQQTVQYLKGVGPMRAKALQRLGIETVRDLIEHVPRRHIDYSNLKPIPQLMAGETETLKGVVTGVAEQRPRPGLLLVKVYVSDGYGTACGTWFNQPYMAKLFQTGMPVLFSGQVQRRGMQVEMQNPEYEILEGGEGELLHAGRVVPVYPLTQGLTPRDLRRSIKQALDEGADLMPDPVPPAVARQHRLLPAPEAWRRMHFPGGHTEQQEGRRTLAFSELFLLQAGLALIKSRNTDQQMGIVHGPNGPLQAGLRAALPFQLTGAQERVIAQVGKDMEAPHPMNRLVQGDVGSGKTMVAAFALLKAVESGHQGALMAPTEILAEQHYLGLRRLLNPLGIEVVLLTGSQTKRERETVLGSLRMGLASVAVGTHALIQEGVQFRSLSLVVTDEQHRFGVRQRQALAALGPEGLSPDVLVMTATPIPRTLALTLYGDLDVSVIDELPPGRKPIETYWLTEAQRRQAYYHLVQQVEQGRQGYVICPLVEESDKLQAEAAVSWLEKLQGKFPAVRFGLLHGRMKAEEKEAAMTAFRTGEIQVLVATTVVEVGVDVPNATTVIIEGADRFGLAQLHQLRGRVGRGQHQSYCLLISEAKTDEARQRMQVMQKSNDGFVISEEDLQLRGPGEFFGTRQSGMPDLKVANPILDLPLLEQARAAALAAVKTDPQLRAPEHQVLRQELSHRLGEEFSLILVS